MSRRAPTARCGSRWLLLISLLGGATLPGACVPPEPQPETMRFLPETEIPLDGLTRRAATLRRRMATRGYGEAVAQTRAFALEGSGFSIPIDIPAGRCASFVALGGGDLRKLELTLYDGTGAPVVTDVAEGEGGLAHVCPPAVSGATYAPHHLVLLARRGSGAVQVSMFLSDAGEGHGFQDLFQGVLAPIVASTSLNAELDGFRDSLRDRGFLPASANVVGTLASSGALRAGLMLDADHCYVSIAATGDGVQDADFFLFDPSGAEVARDLQPGSTLRLEHCPSVSGRYTFELRAYRGSGAAGFVTLEGTRQDETQVTAAEGAPSATEVEVRAGARAALAPLVASLLEGGYSAAEWVVVDGTLGPGEARTEEVVLGPGCSILIGAAAESDADLDLYLIDAEGRPVDRDTRVRALARVVACPEQPSPYRVQIKLYGRADSFALVRLSAPPDVTLLRDARLLEAERDLFADPPEHVARTEHSLTGPRPVAVSQTVGAGTCVGFAAGGDSGIEDLDLFLRSDTGELLASDTGPAPWAALRFCAEQSAELSLELRAYRGAGQVVMERLEQPEQDQ